VPTELDERTRLGGEKKECRSPPVEDEKEGEILSPPGKAKIKFGLLEEKRTSKSAREKVVIERKTEKKRARIPV